MGRTSGRFTTWTSPLDKRTLRVVLLYRGVPVGVANYVVTSQLSVRIERIAGSTTVRVRAGLWYGTTAQSGTVQLARTIEFNFAYGWRFARALGTSTGARAMCWACELNAIGFNYSPAAEGRITHVRVGLNLTGYPTGFPSANKIWEYTVTLR